MIKLFGSLHYTSLCKVMLETCFCVQVHVDEQSSEGANINIVIIIVNGL